MDLNRFEKLLIMSDSQQVKRVAVRCRCGERNVFELPGEICDTDLVAVMQCKCGQHYGIHHMKVMRLDDKLRPERPVLRSEVAAPVVQMVEQEDSLRGKIFQPESKEIN
jgi:hypothetical protein